MYISRITYNSFFLTLMFVFAGFASAETEISTHSVRYVSGEDTVTAYLAMPDGEGPFPALIVIHEWWGLSDWIKQNADEFARHGYVALAVDLYRGRLASSQDEAHELMRGLPEDRAAKDLKSAFAYLQENPNVMKDRIGSIGWCMGGGYSLVAALNISDLAASVVCYGRLVSERDDIAKISCPILGLFGEKDRGIPAVSTKAFERTAQSLDKNVRITVYPTVGHGFMNPNNKNGYDEKSANDAWQKIYSFFDSKVKKK
jgi:carboxymethylenebutenolidase